MGHHAMNEKNLQELQISQLREDKRILTKELARVTEERDKYKHAYESLQLLNRITGAMGPKAQADEWKAWQLCKGRT